MAELIQKKENLKENKKREANTRIREYWEKIWRNTEQEAQK